MWIARWLFCTLIKQCSLHSDIIVCPAYLSGLQFTDVCCSVRVYELRPSADQDDIKELKRQLKLQAYQVDQMKEELQYREAIVTKLNLDRISAENEMEIVKARHL